MDNDSSLGFETWKWIYGNERLYRKTLATDRVIKQLDSDVIFLSLVCILD